MKKGKHTCEHEHSGSFGALCYHSVATSCLTLCDPVDCTLPGLCVHGIFHARILEQATISYPKRSSQPKDQLRISCFSCIAGGFFTTGATWVASISHVPEWQPVLVQSLLHRLFSNILGIIIALCFPRPYFQCHFPAPHSICAPLHCPICQNPLCFSRSQPQTLCSRPMGFPERPQVGCQHPEDSKAAESPKACQGQILPATWTRRVILEQRNPRGLNLLRIDFCVLLLLGLTFEVWVCFSFIKALP